MYYLSLIIEMFLDIFEDLFVDLFMPVGKQLLEILGYSLIVLAISIGLTLFNKMCFISWKEALLSSCVILCFILCSYRGRFSVLKNKVLNRKGSKKRDEN